MADKIMPKKHESYGMISFSRASSSGKRNLFGSSIQHGNTIFMRLHHAELERTLNTDWYSDDGLIAEIELSNAQFAELITSLNQGNGVPCTIKWLNGKDIEPCPMEDKSEKHRREFSSHQDNVRSSIDDMIESTRELFNKKSLSKADREAILNSLERLKMEVVKNSEHQVAMFDEQMAKTVTEAKSEIEAFVQNKIIALGNQTLVQNIDAIKLEGKDVVSIDAPEDEEGDL